MLAEQETVSPGARLPRVGGAGPGGSPPGHDPRLTPSRRPWAQHAGQPNDDIRTFQGSEQRAQMFQFVFAASEVWQARTARVRGATARLVDRLAARLSHSSLPHEPTADHWSAAGPRLFASGCPPPLREPMAAPAGYSRLHVRHARRAARRPQARRPRHSGGLGARRVRAAATATALGPRIALACSHTPCSRSPNLGMRSYVSRNAHARFGRTPALFLSILWAVSDQNAQL